MPAYCFHMQQKIVACRLLTFGQMNEPIPLDLNREQPFRWRPVRRSTVKTPTGRANNLSPGPFLKVVDRCGNQAGEPA